MNKNYHRGYLVERLAFKELEKEGYNCVRSSGSHTLTDLIAFNSKEFRLIQLKKVKGKYYNFSKEISEIKKIKSPKNAKKEIWIRLGRIKGREAGWKKIRIK